jgi:putative peptide maturation system protein
MSDGSTRTKALSERPLAEAISLLRGIPRHRRGIRAARAQFERFKASHPDLTCRLLVDAKPGSEDVDFDVLLTLPDTGTVVLSWRPDHDLPWTSLHTDHWAANFVLSVNDRSVSIQSALMYLSTRLQHQPDMMRELVDRALTFAAIEASLPEVSETELEGAVDAFRAGQGLFSAASTLQWLDDMQLTMDALEDLVAESLQLQKFKAATIARKIQPYFKSHEKNFDRLVVMRLEGMTLAAARRAAQAWRRSGACPALDGGQFPLRGRLDTVFSMDIPSTFADQPPGAVIGPGQADDGFWVAQILSRYPARLDGETRQRIGEEIFSDWLNQQRMKAKIR